MKIFIPIRLVGHVDENRHTVRDAAVLREGRATEGNVMSAAGDCLGRAAALSLFAYDVARFFCGGTIRLSDWTIQYAEGTLLDRRGMLSGYVPTSHTHTHRFTGDEAGGYPPPDKGSPTHERGGSL